METTELTKTKVSFIEEINILLRKHTDKIIDTSMFDHLYDSDIDELERTYWNIKSIFERK